MLSSISSNVPNSTFLGLSSIHSDLPKLRSLRVDCRSVIQVNQDVAKILNSLYVTNIRSSMLANHHNQVHSSGSENSLRHLLIQIGRNTQVTSTLSESILQGLTPRTCILPGDKYPYWLTYKGEGASVNFTVPRVNGCNLKGMTLCCVYSPSCVLVNMESDSVISVLIINYTKTTIQLYKGDTMTSLEDEEWLSIISNLGYDDHVEVIVIFGYGFSVKKTVAYLIYNESFDEKVEPSPTTNKNFLVYSGCDDIYRNSTRLRSKECRCYDDEEELYFIRPRKSLKM
ncbi:TMV resistance protein N [Senna tora]|uniref:TMV resistance protein N n=1 Tax=Senna tora TaxID=362788 RepID=A0A834XHB4_9FABA|nr:TMV resistance protein N [Senna tora]